MSNQWPPKTAHVKKDFKQAHDARNDNIPPVVPQPVVTKKMIQDLEKQCLQTPRMELKPPGMKSSKSREQQQMEQIEKMKQRLLQNKGKAKENFNQGRDM